MGIKQVFSGLLVLPFLLSGAEISGIYSTDAIRIDGKLDEPVWKQAPAITAFVRPDGKAVERRTEARIIFTPQAVVFGFKAYIPRKELKLLPKPARDKSPTSMDCVEIMLDTAGAGDGFKHFIVNAANGVFDRLCEQGGFVGDEKWNAEFTSNVQIEEDFWSCEVRIPYRALGLGAQDNKAWKLNLCRESFGSPTAPREVSSICGGAFNTAAVFLPLAVPREVDLEPFKLELAAVKSQGSIADGKMKLKLETSVRDLAKLARDLRAELLIAQPGADPVRAEESFRLAPGGGAALVFDAVLAKPGRYEGIMTLRDRASNRILLRREFPVDAVYTPIRIELTAPHYRDAIFATQKLENVRFTAIFDLPENARKGTVTAGIRKDGRVVAQATAPMTPSGAVDFRFPVAELPDGKMEIFASFGKEEATHVLRKLPYKKGEVWRGTDGNWYKDGKKLFILAGWNHNYKNDYNEFYNIVARDPREGEEFLFYNVNPFLGIRSIKKDIVAGKLTPAVKAFYQKKFDMHKDHPRLFGHFLCDEPDIAGYTQEGFRTIAEYLLELDPYHPFMICPGGGVLDFADMAEISAFHAYPKVDVHRPMANFDKIVYHMDRFMAHFRKSGVEPTITYLHQGFDYSDSGNTDTRVPSYEEFRNQNFLSLILGGKGLMHYNRGVDNFPELYIGMPHLTREQKVVGNEAVIEEDAAEPVEVRSGSLRTLAKRNAAAGEYWVLVCNTSYETGEYSFRFAPFASGELQVLSEARKVSASDGTVKDRFTPFEVHIYTTSKRDFKLPSVKEINAEIAAAYAERRRQNEGNLFYQEHENQTVTVSASSNKFMIFRAENSLWHLADGVVGDPANPAVRPTANGIAVWQDNTPNQLPDSVTIKTRKPVTVGRVEVYPAQDSLKDYTIELLVDGKFVTVAEVKDAKGAMQSVSFAPRQTDTLRLTVTANRGAYSKVFEIKAFEK